MPTPTPIGGDTIIEDTNPATSGVYIGVTCEVVADDDRCVNDFPTNYRHSLSFYVTFTTWPQDLGAFIASENMAAWQAQNVAPLITWDPSEVSYTDIIAGKWDAYFTASALAVKAFPGTIFLRPMHEFNGSYKAYGLANEGADATADTNFIAAWRHMVTVFRQQGATNVRWVWCYANHSVPNDVKDPWNNPANAYPGDDYVDWVAFDAFNRGDDQNDIAWQTFDQLIGASYTQATVISPLRPVMIAELGTNEYGGDRGARKAQWLSTMLTELPPAYPHLRAIGYFDFSNSRFTYALQSSPAAEAAWIAGLRTLNVNDVLNFRGYNEPFGALTSWH